MKPIILIKPKLLSVITFGFANGITLWPFIILNKENESTVLHEKIHIKQQQEMIVIFFYLWYVMEWLLKFIKYRNFDLSYRNISFEREAYKNNNIQYLNSRKHYSWIKYIARSSSG